MYSCTGSFQFYVLHYFKILSKNKINQLPKGILRLAVPLPCFIDVTNFQQVAGQQPRQGTKSCRMGRNSICPSICCLSKMSKGQSEGSEGLLEEYEGLPEGSEGYTMGSESRWEGFKRLPKAPEGLSEGSKGHTEGSDSL